MLVHLIKKYLVWMVLSYIVVVVLVYNFVIVPQRTTIEQYKSEKARVEYDCMKITSSPGFIRSLENVIGTASVQTQNFTWVDGEKFDAGLTFYNYIYGMSKKANLDLLQVSAVERHSARRSQREKLYYTWNVRLTGSFPDVLYMIDGIEHNQRFLVVEEINITRGRSTADSPAAVYDLVFLGIKKDAVDGTKNPQN